MNMIENSTVTNAVYIIDPIYLLIFLFFIGFVYHIVMNKEYKDTLLASIVIGCIIGLIFNTTNLLEWVERIFVAVIFVLIGGFVAVGLKKVLKGRSD